jgi:hypothetical protein
MSSILEPGHALVMDVVRLVVEDRQLIDFANDFAKVSTAVGCLSSGLGTEWRQEIVAQVVVFE